MTVVRDLTPLADLTWSPAGTATVYLDGAPYAIIAAVANEHEDAPVNKRCHWMAATVPANVHGDPIDEFGFTSRIEYARRIAYEAVAKPIHTYPDHDWQNAGCPVDPTHTFDLLDLTVTCLTMKPVMSLDRDGSVWDYECDEFDWDDVGHHLGARCHDCAASTGPQAAYEVFIEGERSDRGDSPGRRPIPAQPESGA